MSAMRKIQVSEAIVHTATVEVKTLMISGRQVTLSVFRQLKNESIFDSEAMTLRGVPWGAVNYFWGDCKPDHLHVVWQYGSELRRACVWERPDRRDDDPLGFGDWLWTLENLAADYLKARARADSDFRPLLQHGFDHDIQESYGYLIVSVASLRIKARLPNNRFKWWKPLDGQEAPPETMEEAWQILQTSAIEYEAYLRKYKELYDQLSQLDQLFIAT
jgi:hypothetical protein